MIPVNNDGKSFEGAEKTNTKQVNGIDKKTGEIFVKASPFQEGHFVNKQLITSSLLKLIDDFSMKIEGKNIHNFAIVDSVKNSVKNRSLKEELGKQFFLSLLIKTEEYAPKDINSIIDALLSDIKSHQGFNGEGSVFEPKKMDSRALNKVVEKFEEKKEIVVVQSDGKTTVQKCPKKIPETMALKRLKQELELVLQILDAGAQKAQKKETNSRAPSVTPKAKASRETSLNRVHAEQKKTKDEGSLKETTKQGGSLASIEDSNIAMERKYSGREDEKRRDETRFDNKRTVEAKDAAFNEQQDRKNSKE